MIKDTKGLNVKHEFSDDNADNKNLNDLTHPKNFDSGAEGLKHADINHENIDLKKVQADPRQEIEDIFVQKPGDKETLAKILGEIEEASPTIENKPAEQ